MKKYLIANWKQNKNSEEIKSWFDAFSSIYKSSEILDIIICPAACYLELVANLIGRFNFKSVFCGAQDLSVSLSGSHTGEVSANQIKDFSSFCIVGHSERGEHQDTVNIKIKNCFESGVVPVVCLKKPSDFTNLLDERAVLVWEDPGNISLGGVEKTLMMDEMRVGVGEIRAAIGARPFLYGGSVSPDNIKDLESLKEFNGYLVGNSSLDPIKFSDISLKIIS